MFGRRQVPSLAGGTEWLNSEPLGPAELRGHVVLVNFCTFTCINWLRQEPYVRAWSKAHRDDGLLVVGIHTPEFSFEHEIGRVRQAIAARGIDYPVAIDNDFAIWSAFDNHYWPALYFVDRDSIIRDSRFGEGRYEQSERLIQDLLGVDRDPIAVEGVGPEAPADWDNLATNETYLGYDRSEHFTSSSRPALDRPHTYAFQEGLPSNRWSLAGEWTIARESAVLERAGGSIVYRFHARDVHLVMSSPTGTSIPFRVTVDGAAPGAGHGVDIDEAGRGLLRDGRLYQLIRQVAEVRESTVEVRFLEPGAEAYAFTFG